MRPFFSWLCHSPIPRCAAVTLVALAFCSLAFCDDIHTEARRGNLDKVKALLKSNPDLVFSKGYNGQMPLHYAADGGYTDVMELLLANKAEANVKDSYGKTPLHLAAASGRKNAVELQIGRAHV